MNQQEAKNKLVQEWLRDITKDRNYSWSMFEMGLLALIICLFTNFIPKWAILVWFVLYPIFYLWFYGMVIKYKVSFSYDKQMFKLDSLYHKLTVSNVRYEKIIYVSKTRDGESYSLAREIWFERYPFAFMEQLKTVEGRAEQKYYGNGIQATYWSRYPGQIDEIAKFIDEYNKQKLDSSN
jgi:hypothetical protein